MRLRAEACGGLRVLPVSGCHHHCCATITTPAQRGVHAQATFQHNNNSSILIVLRHSLMVLAEICPKDAQGSFFSNAEQDQDPVSKSDTGSDCYSVIGHEVCVMKFISSTWPGIRWCLLAHTLKKSKEKSKVRLWTKIVWTENFQAGLSKGKDLTLL